nr:hypothetical protein [Desulfobacterales bacterium]
MIKNIIRVSIWIIVAFFTVQLLTGCGSPTGGELEDGRLFVINNLRGPDPSWGGGFHPYLWVMFEEVKTEVPWNMDYDGNPTGVGPIELTRGSGQLPGGTRVRLKYGFMLSPGSVATERELNVTIDGNTTVEFYMKDWWSGGVSDVGARIHKGRWDYPAQIPPKEH